jgi:endonuclease/exonuclease/phosphatase family metal-dependent hydrolase
MKIITLNTWGGKIREPFLKFIEKYKDVDIFCFQEIYDNAEEIMGKEYPDVMLNGFSDLQKLLPGHQGFYRPVLLGVYGIAIFVKKNIQVTEEGDKLIHSNTRESITDGHHSRNMQWIKFNLNGKELTLINVHGMWTGTGKNDTPERLSQSNIIRELMDKPGTSKIVCGDFNLNPDTESVKILAEGMQNLIKDFSITSTRTSYYTKNSPFADYMFASKDLKVKDFKVLPEEASDHSALLLEI